MKLEVRSEKSDIGSQFAANGFEILLDIISPDACDSITHEVSERYNQEKSKRGKVGGIRNLLETSPRVAEFASSFAVKDIMRGRLGDDAFPVRALFFDKTADANWAVSWHQDLIVAVAERVEAPGFESWSVKDGVVHAQPPREVLDSMATIRLHLDDCDASNGTLKVIAGSHLHGKLSDAQIAALATQSNPMLCEVRKGGCLLMRPLLLHSSSRAENPSHRRVLHIEYATEELSNGLRWLNSM